MNCPRCKKPLVPGRLAEHSILEKVQVCESCKGTFIGPQDLHEVEIQEHAAFFEFRHVPSADEQKVPLQCPACEVTMAKVVSERDDTVVMDYCPKCQHTWLDAGEIEAMQTESLLDTLRALFRGPRS
jgi:Zn-finger nucleic acid-binding protein